MNTELHVHWKGKVFCQSKLMPADAILRFQDRLVATNVWMRFELKTERK